MLASLPPRAGARAASIGSRFHLDPVAWYSRAEAIELLPRLASAVWNDRRARIEYSSWKGEVAREVEPLGLVLKAGVWYLVAAAGGKPRTYRVSNIRSLEVLESAFRRPGRFDLGRYWAAASRDFEARLLRERAQVRLSPEGLRLLGETNAAAAEAAAAHHRPCPPDGWIRAEIPIEGLSYATRQLLRLGADVEVLAPRALRQAIAREARRVAAVHSR
jgi:predicted DNA-binding transcriptional regulator YafY